ncbi:hypothetical protein [Myxococcus sp. Y35]|uniref:hypothetical protein n=1 Tax=Pseudomyxococcus flavus TaxID=3115648 RepID=UPI003CFBB914
MRTAKNNIRWVRSDAGLAGFRKDELNEARALEALATHQSVLLNVDPGVGKSHLIDRLVARLRRGDEYDLVVYLTPQKGTLAERPFVREYQALTEEECAVSDIVVLEGRPRERCGSRDAEWRKLEQAGCASLGRTLLCAACPERSRCSWVEQLSKKSLEGKRVVAGTQAYLIQAPRFIRMLKRLTGGRRVLVILDESTFLDSPLRGDLKNADLQRNLLAVAEVQADTGGKRKALAAWSAALTQMLEAGDGADSMPRIPRLNRKLAAAIQEAGLRRWPGAFKYLGFELEALNHASWWRTKDGVGYIRRPEMRGADVLITAAGIPLELARQRLGEPNLQELCPAVRFLHEGTRLYNIKSHLGAATYYPKNASQILFASAQLIGKFAGEGKRVLAVVKKRFAKKTATVLEGYLREVTGVPFRVVVNPGQADIQDGHVVPLITYGAVGSNAFEHFDVALALSSYNARPDLMEERLNDVHHPEEEVRLSVTSHAGQRVVRAKGYFARQQGFDVLAQKYQVHLEAGWAVQALGRVRFATRPRTVVFFQPGGVPYEDVKEFGSLKALREHFGLLTRREWEARRVAEKATALGEAGKSRAEVAAALGVSERTVSRRWARLWQG